MTRLRPSAALLAASLLLALAVPADEVGFHPKTDAELKKELEITVELKPERIDFTMNGEAMPAENLGGLADTTARIKLRVGVTDKYVQAKEGRPTNLLRTFDTLLLSYEAGEDKTDAPKFGELEGKTIRFKWNADSESYEKSFHESKGDDALLESLSEDMDVRLLLPAKKVAEGETWEVTGDKLLPFFLPGGLPGEIASENDKDEVKTALEEFRPALGKFQEDLKVMCKYKGARDEGGERVGEIDFTFSNKAKVDLSRLIQTLWAMEESDVHPDVDAGADIDLQGSGTLLWDLAGGRVHSFTMRSETGIDLDIKSSFEVEGENVEMLIKAHVAGKADWSLSTSKP